MAAEAAVRQLQETQARLEADNGRQQPIIGFLDSGIAEADMHLSFMLVSRCALSRKAATLLRREDANQVIRDGQFIPLVHPYPVISRIIIIVRGSPAYYMISPDYYDKVLPVSHAEGVMKAHVNVGPCNP